MPLLEEGQKIKGTYEVERFLGEGAFAEVYRVKHRFLGRQAMKVFKRTGMEISEIEEMLSEAILLSRVGNPNIIRVFDANVLSTENGMRGYFTMENVPGGSLDDLYISYKNDLVPIEITFDLIKQVCRGLSVAHEQNPPVIHRDIKPQNILVASDSKGFVAKVCDFGLAKKVNMLTLLATTAGTLSFKPPEAFTDIKGDSCAADVWGIGTTLYMMLTNKFPFHSSTEFAWGRGDFDMKKYTPPSDVNPDVNAALDKIVLKSLEFDSGCRFQNAGELLSALEEWRPETIRKGIE